ncbi:MAG: alanine/glycine:cation symporter family protein, partial [Bacteroidales bacterium]|nr:alanine/glycine:cation symporter family protein [Bacteroidales bacterium]
VGALFFTIYLKFINIRGFKHSIQVVRGKYDNPQDAGEVSHFQALATALSATVGLGNIAGVAIAITLGGPGATFWMIIAGFLGMSSKFVECTMGVKYRNINADGTVSGGPMYYLSKGLKKRNLGGLGKVLAAIFAVLVIGGSFGGGNMFQANQSFSQVAYIIPSVSNYGAWYGIILAILVGAVIIGGLKSIANVTDKIVPFMAVLYVSVALVIILINWRDTPSAFRLIIDGAFAPGALKGGIIGVLIVGFQRAAFSNEAGVGSAAIAHSAVKTQEPVSEGYVALLEPFIDTVVICTMTALVLIFTEMHNNPLGLEGSALTSEAFKTILPWFPYLLLLAIFLFAFSTMISWSYYGLKGFDYLFGRSIERLTGNRKISDNIFRVLFLFFIVVGSASQLGAVVDFSDMMILAMAFPNFLGLLIMAPEIKRDVKDYIRRVKSGEIKKYK